MITVNATMSQLIKIGHQGENKAVQVAFDLTPFQAAFQGGYPQLVVIRPGDQSGYPVALIVNGSQAIWIVSASDTEKSGHGQCELQWFVGDTLAKSDKYNFLIYSSIPGDAEPPDVPSKTWFEKILSDIGDLSDLDTEAKENLVAAINEARQTGGGGAGGTSDHQKLSNRDAADQHPIAAITGLEAALEGKQPTGNYLTNEALAGAVDDALEQAKASGEFDGADGKTAYQYAQDGGYTGTEAEFAEKLAAEIPAIDNTLSKAGQAADAAKVGEEISSLSEEIGSLGGDTVSVEPAEDDIPKVFFGGALQQTKDAAVVPFRYISKTQDISGYAEIKAQGNSSMSYPKKNQTVKLFKDADCTEKLKVDFKGWGMQNKHVYKANWIDLSHARNIVSARLWADVVKSRAGYENLPELLRTSPNHGAVDGFPVKVYAAGVYQGRYTLNIPKDKWMVNMDDALDTHCILCGENYVSGCFRAAASINGSDWTDEIHDTVPDAIKTRWNEVISFVMNSTDDEFVAGLGDYFYVDSLIDYHLFGLASCGLDAYGKNQIYMTYDGQKWIASMYDMDSTWGLYWNGGKFVTTDYARTSYEDFVSGQSSGEGNLLYIRLEQCFYTELQARWTELKNGALSIENIINRFERFTDIAKSELVKEDYASTTGGGAFIGIPSQSTNNIQQIRSFALARQTWCDEYIAGLTPAVKIPCTSITLSAETLTFSEAGTQTLTATVEPENTTDSVVWSVDDNSVADVSGGTVTAKANGSCVVTVTCGEKSATCDVFVSGIESGGNEGGFELAPEDTMYSLGDETSFDGSSDYIDTGIYLFDTAKDFTILLHADLSQQTMSNVSCVIHCIDEDAALWPGLSIESNSNGYKLGGAVDTSNGWGSYAVSLPNTIDKIVIRASDGVVNAVRYANNGEIVDYVFSKEYKYAVATQPLVLGCRLLANGSHDRYWKGVIYGFDVANRALTDDEITSFLNT